MIDNVFPSFIGYSVPFLTRIITIVVAGGSGELKKNGKSLARDARIIFEKLGPTYIKMGQMLRYYLCVSENIVSRYCGK